MVRTPDIHRRRKGASRSNEAAAAAALVGAVAIGGGLVRGRRAASKREAEQAFRLSTDETIPDGIRRLAREQLDRAHRALAHRPRRKLAPAVHDARKSLKRLRATVRLARGALGDEAYRRENTAFRDAGRRLSGVRDAAVLVDTLDALVERSGDDLPKGATASLRDRLEAERKQALESLAADEALVARVTTDLDDARTRVATWTFESAGFEALEPGLRRIYGRGRTAMRLAQASPTDEHLHEWRKRVKDLWHAEQILRPAAPKKLARRTHRLADLLGADHDLAELRRYAQRHRGSVGDRTAEATLMAVIERRRNELQRQADGLGAKLYAPKPKRFVAAIRRGWDKRAAAA